MSGAQKYTEEQKQKFVDRAAQIGLTPAQKELGYPASLPTASRWCSQMGVTITLSALQSHAASINQFYGAQEKLALCQKILDEAYDVLINGEKIPRGEETVVLDANGNMYVTDDPIRIPVRAATLSQLSGVVQRTIQTMELLEGRVTDRIEQVQTDTTDIELAQMISEYKAKNDAAIQDLS